MKNNANGGNGVIFRNSLNIDRLLETWARIETEQAEEKLLRAGIDLKTVRITCRIREKSNGKSGGGRTVKLYEREWQYDEWHYDGGTDSGNSAYAP